MSLRIAADLIVDGVMSGICLLTATWVALRVRRGRDRVMRLRGVTLGEPLVSGWLLTLVRGGAASVGGQVVAAMALFAAGVVVLGVTQSIVDGPSWAETTGIVGVALAVVVPTLFVQLSDAVRRARAWRDSESIQTSDKSPPT